MSSSDWQLGHDAPLDVFLLISSVRAWEAAYGGRRAGRAAYRQLRDQIPVGTAHRAAVFWAFEPGVPKELQGTGLPTDMVDDDLTVARMEWLLGDGAHHLHPGEAERARDALRDIGL